jgi:calcium-dependent protein kinase
MSTKNDLDQS